MANVITEKTVCRALLFSLAKERTCESFAQAGADYRSLQNSSSHVQQLINWLAQLLDKNYATRTWAEIQYKKQALHDGFMGMAEQVLMAKVAIDGTVHINFEIGSEPIEIHSFPANPGKLFVRHLSRDVELEKGELKQVKEILLKHYLQMKRDAQEDSGDYSQIDLTAFDLSGCDLRSLNLRNCALPDLVRCNLNHIQFDTDTTFKKRQMCKFDNVTFDRLQAHRAAQSGYAPQEFPIEVTPVLTTEIRDDTPMEQVRTEDPPISMAVGGDTVESTKKYTYEQLFSSDNPDLATIKRQVMLYRMPEIPGCFELMRSKGLSINLAHVDLSGLNLEGMNLEKVNLHGADLTGSSLEKSNLHLADLRSATLDRIRLSSAELALVIQKRAKIKSVLIRDHNTYITDFGPFFYFDERPSNLCSAQQGNRQYRFVTFRGN